MNKKVLRRAFRAYQKVKTLKPNRSVFDLSHEILTTGDAGKLYVCSLLEMSPGDTMHIWNQSVCRMQPLNAPILHPLSLSTHYFFCPYRILWEEWTEFITGGVEGAHGGNLQQQMPSVSPQLPRWNPTNTGVGSLWDYCGFPINVIPAGALPLDFVRRCYNRIYNEFYRDETLQEEVPETNEAILYRNWKKDYFTSALLSQQRGVAPSLPVNGVGQAASMTSSSVSFTKSSQSGSHEAVYQFPIDGILTQEMLDSATVQFTSQHGNDSLTITERNLTTRQIKGVIEWTSWDPNQNFSSSRMVISYTSFSGSSVDIKDLRVAFQIQRWLELANRGGVRYTEFLRSFFGVSPRDDRLQRPEYVGGTKTNIIVSEVLQTSATNSEPTALGNMAGHGISANSTYVGSYTAVEFGILMGIMSVMPEAKYQQGINRQWLRRSKFDFLFPQFTHLSETAIEQAEIYAEDTEAKNRKVFGFNEIYDELRSIPSLITGKMRTVFDYWHLGRKFSSAPALNSDFIQCKPSKRIFAVPDEDGFIFSIGNVIRAVRPLPKYGTPGGC